MVDEYPILESAREFFNTPVEFEIIDDFHTKQQILFYERYFPENDFFGGRESCIRLDGELQLWESGIRDYHRGLVNAPLSFFTGEGQQDVLLIGGGDWIAIKYLQERGANVTHVDYDGEFLEYTKTNSFLSRYHESSYKYDSLNTQVVDAFDYLSRTNREFDLILLDLPDVDSDDLLRLFSVEFYEAVCESLTEQGMAVIWRNPPEIFVDNYKVYMRTIRAAGFEKKYAYKSHRARGRDGNPSIFGGFYLLTTGNTPAQKRPWLDFTMYDYGSDQLNRWTDIPKTETEPNYLESPNTDIIIDITTV